MTPDHLRRMQEARERATAQRHDESTEAVREFVAYLKASRRKGDGTWPRVHMPRIPKDTEFAIARERGVIA